MSNITIIPGIGPRPEGPDTNPRRVEFHVVDVTGGFATNLPGNARPIAAVPLDNGGMRIAFIQNCLSAKEEAELTEQQARWDEFSKQFAAAQLMAQVVPTEAPTDDLSGYDPFAEAETGETSDEGTPA